MTRARSSSRRALLMGCISAAVIVLAGAGVPLGLLASSRAGANEPSGIPQEVLAAFDTSRVSSIEQTGGVVSVTGVAMKGDQGDISRTLWYETLASAALALANDGDRVERTVVDSAGSELTSTWDNVPVTASPPNPFATTEFSQTDAKAQLENQADQLDLNLEEVNYIDLFGGTVDVLVQPYDMAKTLSSASSSLAELMGPLAEGNRPYLVTVVDKAGAPRLILGFVPGIGGTPGQGIGWQAADVHSDVIVGTPYVPAN